jgi:hypothetical protein
MMNPHSTSWDYVAAMFSYEFQGGGIDYDTLETLHRGDVHEWVEALEHSGLFDGPTIADAAARWKHRPRLLLDILLLDADEMTRKRCDMAWFSLDRLAPFAQSG